MYFKNTKSYITRFIQITLSSDQTISSDSATLVEFASISGDSGYKMSLNSGTTGRIDFKGGSQYYVIGTTSLHILCTRVPSASIKPFRCR